MSLESPESSPEQPEKNWFRERLDALMKWVGLGDEKQEVKDQLDVLFDTQKPKEDRLQSLLYFRNKFFPDGIENGKPVHLQIDWTKDVDKRLDAILEQRGISDFVPNAFAHAMYHGKVFSEKPDKKGYWHEEERLPLTHGMEITFYKEDPDALSHCVSQLRDNMLLLHEKKVHQIQNGDTISALFGSGISTITRIDSTGDEQSISAADIKISHYVWKNGETIYMSRFLRHYNGERDFEQSQLSPDKKEAFKQKSNATLRLAAEYMRFDSFQGRYDQYYEETQHELNKLLRDEYVHALTPKEFDELCTEVRREISRRMFSQMPGSDFELLREQLYKTYGSDQKADEKIAAYMGTHTKPYERKEDFYKTSEIIEAIRKASIQTGVPIDWIVKVIIIESEGDQHAFSGFAFGLMGLKYDVFMGFGHKRAQESTLTFEHTINPVNAWESILRGAEYLLALRNEIGKSDYYKHFKSVHKLNIEYMTLQAYNMGPTAMRRLLSDADENGTDYRFSLPEETKKYVGQLQDWSQIGENTLSKILRYIGDSGIIS